MRTAYAIVAAVGLALMAEAHDASACGGFFTPPVGVTESQAAQVKGHRMILSISTTQTTLYDQIKYSGNPSSFAWILPVKGTATIGLSSDALFGNLDLDTQVLVEEPILDCGCGNGGGSGAGGGSGTGGGSSAGPVNVVAHQVVGPYETVQLQSTNPSALQDWLTSHGYDIPADVAPVIAAYVSDGFDFVALKLVPGMGVSAMRPVRVTTPGAGPVLPLRMIAAGTGSVTPVTLWILGEGRYQPTNMPIFEIDPAGLTYDFDTFTSNYATLQTAGFTATGGKGWCLEYALPSSMYLLEAQLQSLIGTSPDQSGYADATGLNAQQNLSDDLGVLFSDIPDSSLWITRLESRLSREALAADLQIGASADQSEVQNVLVASKSTGDAPTCGCGTGGGDIGSGSNEPPRESSSCAMTTDRDAAPAFLGSLAAFFALGLARTRRRRPRRA